jgi:hypothetical protein
MHLLEAEQHVNGGKAYCSVADRGGDALCGVAECKHLWWDCTFGGTAPLVGLHLGLAEVRLATRPLTCTDAARTDNPQT